MAKKLGRGLDALLGEEVDMSQLSGAGSSVLSDLRPTQGQPVDALSLESSEEEKPAALMVSIEAIDPNPYQPRKEFAPEELAELAESIKKIGIIQPLTLRQNGDRYQIISGERRLRAARQAGLKEVPAYLREVDTRLMRVMALVENIQRSDLNAIEIAMGYQELIEAAECSHEELAEFVGKSRASVTNMLRLLRLPRIIQQAIVDKRISMGHARALLGLEQEVVQLELLRLIEEKGLSVRDVEALVKERLAQQAQALERKEASTPERKSHERQDAVDQETLGALQARLGWGLSVSATGKEKGRIVIEFRSEGEKQELLRKLLSIGE